MLSEHIISQIKQVNKDTFYLYDFKKLRNHLDKLSCLPSNVKAFFAIKANPNNEVIGEILSHKNVYGAEIASQGEGEKILNVEKDLSKTIFTGPAKTPEEIEFAINNKIKTLNVESLTEAHRINNFCESIGKKQDILLRINVNQELHGSGKMSYIKDPSPFGIPEEAIDAALKEISKLKNINLLGFHTYPATGVLDYAELIKSVEYTFDLCSRLEKLHKKSFEILDFGGGFGIDYSGDHIFEIENYSTELEKLIKKYHFENKTFFLELGRYLCSDMGFFVTKIIDIKESKGAKLLSCAGGINAHRRPSIFGSYTTTIVPMGDKLIYPSQASLNESDRTLICGPLCTSVDTLSKGVVNLNQKANIGDYLVQSKAGAYGLTMSLIKFLSHPETEEIVLK